MKYVHTGLYSAPSWPCTATADCLPPTQVLPAGNGHGEHLTSLSKSCQGGAFSRRDTTVLTPKEPSVDGGGCETLLGQCVQPLQSVPEQCDILQCQAAAHRSLCVVASCSERTTQEQIQS